MEKRWIIAALAVLSGAIVLVALTSAPPTARSILIGMLLSIWVVAILVFRGRGNL